MGKKLKPLARRKGRHLRVPVLPTEEETIKRQAAAAGLSISAYLRNLALGYEIRSALDQDLVLQLAKINGDQGRLGGLLKLWLTNDEKLAAYDRGQMLEVIRGVLDRIKETQGQMLELVKKT
ncbi:MAG: conjugal transfer transcriptional regulator TraJ [Gammaproteobacteria bacterium]